MKVSFEITARMEGIEDLREEHRAAILDELIGLMSGVEIGEWIAGSKYREHVLYGADIARGEKPS